MEKPTINIKYIFEKDFNPKYVNGAIGGVCPSGELVMNFYLERMPLPYEVKHEINENGTLGDAIEIKPEGFDNNIVRFISQGITMNLKTAEETYTWLGSCIELMKGKESNVL